MSKEEWFKHIDSIPILRVSLGADKSTYASQIKEHIATGCKLCKNRMATVRANRASKAKHQAYLDCGLVRVKSALGGTYYE